MLAISFFKAVKDVAHSRCLPVSARQLIFLQAELLVAYVEERVQQDAGFLISAEDAALVLNMDSSNARLLFATAGALQEMVAGVTVLYFAAHHGCSLILFTLNGTA